MIDIFKKDYSPGYKDTILKAFPTKLKNDVEVVLNILPLRENKIKLFDGIIYKVENLIHSSSFIVLLNSETLSIPYRLYFNEPNIEDENKLTETQRAILNCIYTRHHNGHLRQKRLQMLRNKNDIFTIPFSLQLLGEYVYEIYEELDVHINETTINLYKQFIYENPIYWQRTESRMISYWNAYYRQRFPKLQDYIGRIIANRIEKAIA